MSAEAFFPKLPVMSQLEARQQRRRMAFSGLLRFLRFGLGFVGGFRAGRQGFVDEGLRAFQVCASHEHLEAQGGNGTCLQNGGNSAGFLAADGWRSSSETISSDG